MLVGLDIGIVAVTILVEICIRVGQALGAMLLSLCKATGDAVVVLEIQQTMRSHHKESFDIGRILLLACNELLVAFEKRTDDVVVLAADHAQIGEFAVDDLEHRHGMGAGRTMLAIMLTPLMKSQCIAISLPHIEQIT